MIFGRRSKSPRIYCTKSLLRMEEFPKIVEVQNPSAENRQRALIQFQAKQYLQGRNVYVASTICFKLDIQYSNLEDPTVRNSSATSNFYGLGGKNPAGSSPVDRASVPPPAPSTSPQRQLLAACCWLLSACLLLALRGRCCRRRCCCCQRHRGCCCHLLLAVACFLAAFTARSRSLLGRSQRRRRCCCVCGCSRICGFFFPACFLIRHRP